MSIKSMPFTQQDFEFLKLMEGNFITEVTFNDPEQNDYHVDNLNGAIMRNTFIYNHRFFQQSFESNTFNEKTIHLNGIGFIGFNQFLNHFEGFWIDSHRAIMNVDAGVRVDSRLDMMGETRISETESIKKRSAITVNNKNHHLMEFYKEVDQGNEVQLLGLSFRRQS